MAERTVYTHTGWRKLDGKWAYLHGGGAIGASGAVAGVETSLPAALGTVYRAGATMWCGVEERDSRQPGDDRPRPRPGDRTNPLRPAD